VSRAPAILLRSKLLPFAVLYSLAFAACQSNSPPEAEVVGCEALGQQFEVGEPHPGYRDGSRVCTQDGARYH
jgi:hypothetical protein